MHTFVVTLGQTLHETCREGKRTPVLSAGFLLIGHAMRPGKDFRKQRGHFEVERKEGEGSRVTVILPLKTQGCEDDEERRRENET